MKLGEAKRITGGLSFPSKMPGTSFNLPATACITGAKLARAPGTVCHGCYALKDRYTWPNPVLSAERRLAGLQHKRWIDAMVRLLSYTHAKPRIRVDLGNTGIRLQRNGGQRWRWNKTGFHRWHDSGDLQSVEHFAAICEVARRTPQIKHWLPTQELSMVRAFTGQIPDNLIVRVSSVFLDDQHRRAWPHTSSVFVKKAPVGSWICPAPKQQHRCMDCRACWNKEIPHVAYTAH